MSVRSHPCNRIPLHYDASVVLLKPINQKAAVMITASGWSAVCSCTSEVFRMFLQGSKCMHF